MDYDYIWNCWLSVGGCIPDVKKPVHARAGPSTDIAFVSKYMTENLKPLFDRLKRPTFADWTYKQRQVDYEFSSKILSNQTHF